jgi:serine protease Do
MMNARLLGIIVLILVPFLLLAGGIVGYSIGHASKTGQPAEAVREAVDDPTGLHPQQASLNSAAQDRDSLNQSVNRSRQNAITRAVGLASPAVVGINVIEIQQYRRSDPFGDPFFRYFFGDRVESRPVQELGSGFIISPDGYIVTNDHVAGNAKEITVTMTNGEKHKAELVGSDQISDIALLKIDGKNLPYLQLGNSGDVIIGEWAIALGNPFGLFLVADKPTVTVGVISAKDMNLQPSEGRVYRGMIQTDAAINSGNSGGPLINSAGEVIGVNAVIFTPNQGNIGLGFAIPANRVKKVVEELKRSGKVERNFWTGLEVQNVDRRIARYFGLERVEGVIVAEVQKKSPAERAGFRVGDIIMTANGEKIDDDSSLVGLLEDLKPGDTITMRVIRDRQEKELKLKLEKR